MMSDIEEHLHVLTLGEKSLDVGKILSTDTSIKILEAVYNSDQKVGVSASNVSQELGVGRTTVLYHLGRMLDSGLIKINPVLHDAPSWEGFWDAYRKGVAQIDKEQFDNIHTARINGIKLFVPTKKGFLFLPSTDLNQSKSMVKEVLNSITSRTFEGEYRRMKKNASILGSVGLILIALSFLLGQPGLNGPVLTGARMQMSEAYLEGLSDETPSAAAVQPQMEKAEVAQVESAMYGDTANVPVSISSGSNDTHKISEVLFIVGVLLTGSFTGFILYIQVRKRRFSL